MGRPRTLPDAQPRACIRCGVVFTPPRKRWRQQMCSLDCQKAAFRDKGNEPEPRSRAAKKIGDKLRGTGEGKSYVKEGGQHQHRTVAERDILNRALLPSEVVHHLDGNYRNNDPSNLVVLRTQGVHLNEHRSSMASPYTHTPRPPTRYCLVEGCTRRHLARGLCSLHYQRARKENAV